VCLDIVWNGVKHHFEKKPVLANYRKDALGNWLSSSCRGSADDRTVYRSNWCILLLHFGPSHPGLHRDRNLLGRRLRARKLGSLEECYYMRDRPNGANIWITQCHNGYSEIVCLIERIFSVLLSSANVSADVQRFFLPCLRSVLDRLTIF